ncbi:amidase domain-containing protein [Cytobacillus gottheilii]|nr:amidase domain-containing protein [Cytobacillus gottheilii]
MRDQLQKHLENMVGLYVSSERLSNSADLKVERKLGGLQRRNAEIVKAKATGAIIKKEQGENETELVHYRAHFQYLIKQKSSLYIEEEMEEREAEFYKGVLVDDKEIEPDYEMPSMLNELQESGEADVRLKFHYDRLKAVQYAETWWNSYNPAYKSFDVDCTNYISQCLHAGGAPMRGYPNRGKGWWMQNNNWSYSWTVANAMRWHLPGSNAGLQAKEVAAPEQLLLGDVICYDFQGDGRFDHTTIVTGKDADGMPLVNAHTTNSRMRYWAYEDSTAYTPNIKYKFFSINDQN